MTKTYDGAGRLATRTDQGGNVTTFGYDAANRLITKTAPDSKVDAFTLDAVGRLTSGTSERYGTTITRTYDSGGRLATEGLTAVSGGPTYTVGYSYDTADRLTGLQYPDGSAVTRTYTNRDQVASISRGAQTIAQYTYDNGGRLTSTTLGNTLVEARGYRNDDTPSSFSTSNVGNLSYTYDGKKQKLSEGGTATNGSQSFSYDNQGRLTNWDKQRKTLWQMHLDAVKKGEQREFGAYVYMHKDTGQLKFIYRQSPHCPDTAEVCEFKICPALPGGPGFYLVTFLHTHPWGPNPSPGDRETAIYQGFPAFVIHGDSFLSTGPRTRTIGFTGNPGCPKP